MEIKKNIKKINRKKARKNTKKMAIKNGSKRLKHILNVYI